MNLIKVFLVMLLGVWMASCSPTEEIIDPGQSGTYVFDGVYYVEDPYASAKITIAGNSKIIESTIYDSSMTACQGRKLVKQITPQGSYLDGQKMDVVLLQDFLTPLTEDYVTYLNTNSSFGFTDWKLNEQKEVTGLGWDGAAYSAPTVYTIWTLAGNALLTGKKSDSNSYYDGTTDAKRFVDFEYCGSISSSVAYKQASGKAIPNGEYRYTQDNFFSVVDDVLSVKTIIFDNYEKDIALRKNADGTLVHRWDITYETEFAGKFLDGEKINRTELQKIVTLYTQSEVNYYNSSKAMGLSDWAKNTPRDVTGLDWLGNKTSTYYTIRTLRNNRIFWGANTSLQDGSSDSTRPRSYNYSTALYSAIGWLSSPGSAEGMYSTGKRDHGGYMDITVSSDAMHKDFYGYSADTGILEYLYEVTETVAVKDSYADEEFVDIQETSKKVTLYSDSQVSMYNNAAAYGISDWKKGETIEVGALNWDGSAMQKVYTARLVKNNRIYFAVPTIGHDGTSEKKRMTQFNFTEAPFTKVEEF